MGPRALTLALGLFAIGLATSVSAVCAQVAAKVPRLGVLTPGGGCPGDSSRPTTMFFEALKIQGYVPGQSLRIECGYSDNLSDEEFRRLATELVRLDVDAIFAVSSTATRAVRPATTTIPIVALDLETDPIGSGLAASMGRPGGNITGIFLDARELNAKWIELLRHAVPKLSRVVALWDATMDPTPMRQTETVARSLGIQLQVVAIRSPSDLDAALRTAARDRVDAVLVMQSPITDVHRKKVADLALQSRLPTIAMFPTFARDGGLMTYGPDIEQLFNHAGLVVGKVLKGARPAETPIERPTHFYFVINLKTARTLSLTLPPALVQRANEAIR
jgi:putative ABC transport system substrate-binding protein